MHLGFFWERGGGRGDEETFWNSVVVMVAHVCKQTKNHRILHFKKVNLGYVKYISVKKKGVWAVWVHRISHQEFIEYLLCA